MSVSIGLAVVVIAAGGCGRVRPPEGTPNKGTLPPRTATPAIAQIPVKLSSSTPGSTIAVATVSPQTSIPATPAALNPEGPWLLGVGGEDQLIVLNPDGTGLTAVEHQPLWDSYPDVRLGVELSKTGWIAVRTAASTWPDPPTDISLDLFRLPGVQPTRRIPLFSPELVARMGDMGEHTLPYEEQQVEGLNWRYGMVYLVVLAERNPPLWSPDARYLAFVGAIDGPSSDLYVYDTQTDQVRRLTDGPNQAAILGWSPDSRWIIHSEASTYMIADGGEVGGFPANAVWAAAADGSEVKRLYGPAGVEGILGWVSNTEFLVERWSGYIFLHDLRAVDLGTGAEKMHYPGRYYNSALAPDPGVAVVDSESDCCFDAESPPPSEDEYFPGGLHLVPLDEGVPKKLRPGAETFGARWLEWFPQLDRFFAGGFGSPYLFTSSGEITHTFQTETGWPAVSPDGSWLAFDNERERPGLRLYRADGQMVREISQENTYNFVWTPDSSGLYYLVKTEQTNRLMVVSVPDGEPIQLHPNPGLYRFVLVEGPRGLQ